MIADEPMTKQQLFDALAENQQLMDAVVDVSNSFFEVESDKLDDALNYALERFATAAKADRAYLFMLSDDRTLMSNTHEWCASNISSEKENLQNLPSSDFEILGTLQEKGAVMVPNVSELPSEQADFRDHLLEQGINSIVCFSVVWDEQMHGFVGFDAVSRENPWNEHELGLLRTLAQLISGVYKRIANEKALREKEMRLQQSSHAWLQAMDQIDDVIYLLDVNRHLVRANRTFYLMMHQTPESAVGRHIESIIHPEGEKEPCPVCRSQMELRDATVIMEPDDPMNPSGRPIEIITTILRDINSEPEGILMMIHDLTATRESEDRLRLSSSVFEHTKSALLITDAEGVIQQVNPAFTALTGYSAEEAVGQKPNILKSDRHGLRFYKALWKKLLEEGAWEGEIWNRRKNGELFPIWQNISSVKDDKGAYKYFIGHFNDITMQKQDSERIYKLAHYDAITSLPNRRLFEEICTHALKRSKRDKKMLAVLFLDLDRFKHINDSFGHPTGDELLRKVARRLKGLLRSEDAIARLGGDEFIILLEDVKGSEIVQNVAKKIVKLFDEPFSVHEHTLVVSTSIGIGIYPDDGKDVTTLVKHADTAMYEAKESGRNTFRFFSKELAGRAMARLALESELRFALDSNQLLLHYQPQYSLESGEVENIEALIRWEHPERGLVAPDAFIPIAEDSGLILPIGEWVLYEACKQAKMWMEKGLGFQKVSINISGLQIERGDIVQSISHVLNATGLPAHCLELEILETYIMRQAIRDVEILQQLKAMGISLAIDDFGTGQASMAYLKKLPVETLKIDRSFISDIPDDTNDVAITKAIVAMANHMQLRIVAEGVETESQATFLERVGCDMVQGYYYSRPLPAEGIELLMQEDTKK